MKRKILIVEDEQIISYLLESYINSLDCSKVIAAVDNGDDAIKITNEQEIDFILMDVRIDGDKDGIETAEIINNNSKIPIIYISGNSDPVTIERAKKTNMIGFLNKPIDKIDLTSIICNN